MDDLLLTLGLTAFAFLCGYIAGRHFSRPLSVLIWFAAPGTIFAAAPENAALALVAADLKTLDEADRFAMRYIWIEGAVREDAQAVALTMGYYNQSGVPRKPLLLGQGPLMVARVDLRLYASRSAVDLRRMLKAWEEFQFDPKFNLLITKATLQFLAVPAPTVKKTIVEKVAVDVKPFVQDGKTYTQRWETRNKIVDVPFHEAGVDVARLPSEHIDLAAYELASGMCQSQAPLVSHRYFMMRGLTTIQDDDKANNLYKTVYGGLYYELAGVPTAGKKGTDLDALFEEVGIGNVEAGVTAEKLFDRLQSDQRVGMERSGVTGKPRSVSIFPTLLRIGGILSVTSDIRDRDIDIDTDPLMNLLKPAGKPVHESIWEKADGLHGFALHDGNGKLAREVPPDVARDSDIPAPHTDRLEGALGCIGCHARERGWRVLRNDVPGLLKNYIDIYGDNAGKGKNQTEQIVRLAGLYAGNVERTVMPQARDAYANAILRTTGPWLKSKDQTDVVELASAQVVSIVRGHKYKMVDAATALTELGIDPGKEPVALIKQVLPPVDIVIDGIIPEDQRIAALKAGQSINRAKWDLVYSFAASRAAKAAKEKRP